MSFVITCVPFQIAVASVNTKVPFLPLQWNWLHSCVAISCNKNKISGVVYGVKVVDTEFSEKDGCPTRLNGNLVLLKNFIDPELWNQNRGRLTNVNIFSGLIGKFLLHTKVIKLRQNNMTFYLADPSGWIGITFCVL